MSFDERLQRAIQRGKRTRNEKNKEADAVRMSEEEIKNLHSKYRLELSEHIENNLKQLSEQFPGFDYQTVFGEDGWGGKISRDDVNLGEDRSSKNLYSRFEMVIRPYSDSHIVELVGKATIRNKELFNRTNYHFLHELDEVTFRELIDLWVLDFAEQYATI